MILIKNGIVIDPGSGIEGEFDLLIEGSSVKALEKRGAFAAGSFQSSIQKTIDAGGCWVTPGLVDLHVHLREPGFEWKETVKSGSQAAILGGFTTICCMPNTNPTNDCAEVTKYILEKAHETKAAKVRPIGAVSLGLKGKEMSPLSELRQAGCVAFSDDGEPIYDAGLMRRALEWAGMLGAPISCHEEDKCLSLSGSMNESPLSTRLGLRGWPKVAEEVMIARDIELCRVTGSPVHICHVSTARGVELVRRAKADGFRISAEVTPHHLMLTEDAVSVRGGNEYNTYAKMSPPLRNEEDVEALRIGLKEGVIDAIASDHAPHERDSKEVEFGKASMGIIGLQTNLPLALKLVRDGVISRSRAIESFSAAPAKVFGLEAGKLKGGLADIVIVDPEAAWNFSRDAVKSLSFNSPFLDQPMQGLARTVLVDGQVVLEDRRLLS